MASETTASTGAGSADVSSTADECNRESLRSARSLCASGRIEIAEHVLKGVTSLAGPVEASPILVTV